MRTNKFIYASAALAILAGSSCHNSDQEFPDFEGGSAVYFAYQDPVRTIVLGEDTYNTDADNEHRCAIFGVSGGTYNGITATVALQVDESLVDGKYFDYDTEHKILAMPKDYYELEQPLQLNYNKSQNASIGVQLKEAFFNDPLSIENNYVIPLKMTNVSGDSKILADKDYVLYCVKFINQYHANFLRRGVDVVTDGNTTVKNVRHNGVEKDEVISTKTLSLNSVKYSVNALAINYEKLEEDPEAKNPVSVMTRLEDKTPVVCDLKLTFDDNGDCSIESMTEGVKVSGKGHYGKKSEILAWGNKDRDGLYLDYTIQVGNYTMMAVKDTLVLQSRGAGYETFHEYVK